MAKEKSEFTKALDEHNIKTLAVAQSLMTWENIDLNDPRTVEKRCHDYFKLMAENNIRPLVSALALALGIDRRRLWEIATGQVTRNKETHICKESKDIITRAYRILEVFWESAISSGKINPVAGIFIARNNFGYSNETEIIIDQKRGLGEAMTEAEREAMEQRYLLSVGR